MGVRLPIEISLTAADYLCVSEWDEARASDWIHARLGSRPDDLFDTRDSPRTRSMVLAAVQCAERIMRKVEECSGTR